jgi:DNA-directed RNA polymerase subunit RPC12/RpoP
MSHCRNCSVSVANGIILERLIICTMCSSILTPCDVCHKNTFAVDHCILCNYRSDSCTICKKTAFNGLVKNGKIICHDCNNKIISDKNQTVKCPNCDLSFPHCPCNESGDLYDL